MKYEVSIKHLETRLQTLKPAIEAYNSSLVRIAKQLKEDSKLLADITEELEALKKLRGEDK